MRAAPPAPSGNLAGYGLVLLGATLWGTLGVTFRLLLRELPLTPVGLAYVRAALAFLLLLAALAVCRPQLLRVRRADLPYLALYGAISVSAFYYLYIQAVALTSVATAVVLLYTAPAWVALLAWRLYGEPLRGSTLAALAVTFGGCALVAGVAEPGVLAANVPGVLAGLGSGLTYGLYSIFGKRRAVARYHLWTVLLYVLGFGALLLALAQTARGESLLPPGIGPTGWVALLLVALLLTLAPLAAYTAGLRRLPASVASILSTWEPAVGALLGFLVLGETLSPAQLLGAVLILAGVLLLRLPARAATPPGARRAPGRAPLL